MHMQTNIYIIKAYQFFLEISMLSAISCSYIHSNSIVIVHNAEYAAQTHILNFTQCIHA